MNYQLLSNETCGFVYSNENMLGSVRSVISVSAVQYFTKCGIVWCGAYI